MKILKVNQNNQQKVATEIAKSLAMGELVVFPTETTYGAGVDATNQQAVDKLLAYKTRREGKPLSIAVSNIEMAGQYVELNETARKFYQTFLPGPFTIISKSKHQTAKGVESEFGTLGVRIPDYQLVIDFLREFGRPVTATSANVAGKKSPYQINDLLENLSDKQKSLIDLIVDAGELPKNKPSTIIDTTLSAPITLRQGDQLAIGTQNLETEAVEFISKNEEETKNLAKRLILKNWKKLKTEGLIIGLDGELGVGKTIFTKGVAEFLQIAETITSPTYAYVNEYEFERHGFAGRFYHFDVWKVESKEELVRLDFFDYLKPGNLVVIEWWQQIENFVGELPVKLIKVGLQEEASGERKLKIREL